MSIVSSIRYAVIASSAAATTLPRASLVDLVLIRGHLSAAM
jgi:hypothetical protein